MSSNGDDRTHLVHEARKTIKRMRALARLLRREIGKQEFRQVNASLRDAAKRLAGARDAQVRLSTLEDLRELYPDQLCGEPIQALLVRLASMRADPEPPEQQPATLADIAEMRRDLLRWRLFDHEDDALTTGLRSIYRDGRRRYSRAKRSHGRDPIAMHDWRKRVKSLYYALDMLGGKQNTATAKLTRRANRLGETLGLEHDLWMLADFLQSEARLDRQTRELLLALIERRRERLRRRALKLGARLYSRKPRRFAARAGRALSR
ncbi:MAG TPA: CHAD domain-containing protein [Solirubrobacteraceae bacterium]|nr:CHAD domain-containing protein [Solirubrobacteraceae bacterium]